MKIEISVPTEKWSRRPNHLPGEGGALNAGYTPVDALARICNLLGQHDLHYGKDFYWDSFQYTNTPDIKQYIQLTFSNKESMLTAKLALESTT